MLAITVLGLAGVALIGGFDATTGASAEYRNLATIDTVLKSFAESATNQIQLQTPTPIFSSCATFSGQLSASSNTLKYAGSSLSLTYVPPSNYNISVAQIQYLYNNTTFEPNTPPTQCDSTQDWPQLVTVNATGPKSAKATLSFVVVDPLYENNYVPPTTTATTTTTTVVTTTTTTTTTSTTTTTIPTTTTTILAPTISFPTNTNPYCAGHNAGTETLTITGTNLATEKTVAVSSPFTLISVVSVSDTSIVITLNGSGGNNAKGSLTVTLTNGASVTYNNALVNGGTYSGVANNGTC